MQIIGNAKTILSMHGFLDSDKLIQAIGNMADTDKIDIKAINDASELGGLYVAHNGKILNTFNKGDESLARYKLVPTGLKFRHSEYPLFASFIKLHGQWEGCFIGTGTMLFDMYKSHYNGDFCNDYVDIFGGDNRVRDISGFGLAEVLLDGDKINEYSDTDNETSASSELALALKRLQNKEELDKQNSNTSKKSSKNLHKSKNQRKAEKLQKHLEKVKENERKKVLAAEKAEEESESNNMQWVDILPMEDVHSLFEDEQTKEFNKKIEEYINSDDTSDAEPDTVDNVESAETVCVSTEESDSNTSGEELKILEEFSHNNRVTTESDRYKMQIKNDIINDIFERLLIKENWKGGHRNKLGYYLKAVCFYVWREQKTNDAIKGNGYTFSNDKKLCIINTGLIDKYGNYIYILDHSPKIPDFYTKIVSVVYNKVALLKNNFNIDNIKFLPEPIKFVDNAEKLVFKAEYSDFDLDDTTHIYHIATERIGRFPNKYANDTVISICDKIRASIRQAIMMAKTDYKYIIPKYDFTRKEIQFLIPLYLDNSYDEAPELTIIVGEQENGIWSIFTVLYTEDAYDDARLTSGVRGTWLDPNRNGGNKNENIK